jgi:PIN domain nuclease of toxin-antitoxin system
VTYLLDTHVLLWLLGEPDRIPADVLAALARRDNDLLTSSVSAMEVATKVRLGKLDNARHLVETWSARVREIDADELSLSAQHALLGGSMSWGHRDPFDRLLVAQALVENVVLVSTDSVMSSVPGLRLLTW